MTLLSICRDVSVAVGIGNPASIVNNTSPDARSLLYQANTSGKALAKRHTWQAITREATFTTLAASLQGAFSSLGGGTADYSDFGRFVADTMWNRTQNEKIEGPLSPVERQMLLSSVVTGPYPMFWIRGNSLYFYPNPTAGHNVYFEYISKNWCEAAGGTDQSAWAADTDVGLLDEELIKLDMVWRLKKSRGLDYAEDFATFEAELASSISQDGGKKTLRMSVSGAPRPGIVVPEGSWSL